RQHLPHDQRGDQSDRPPQQPGLVAVDHVEHVFDLVLEEVAQPAHEEHPAHGADQAQGDETAQWEADDAGDQAHEDVGGDHDEDVEDPVDGSGVLVDPVEQMRAAREGPSRPVQGPVAVEPAHGEEDRVRGEQPKGRHHHHRDQVQADRGHQQVLVRRVERDQAQRPGLHPVGPDHVAQVRGDHQQDDPGGQQREQPPRVGLVVGRQSRGGVGHGLRALGRVGPSRTPRSAYARPYRRWLPVGWRRWKDHRPTAGNGARLSGQRSGGTVPGTMQYRPLSLNHLFERAERLNPTKEVVTATATGVDRYTYGEWADRTRRLAAALDSLGISPDGRVATFAWNTGRHLELYFAAPCSGRVLHTLNIRLFPEQVTYIVNHAEDEVIFVDRSLLGLLARL